MSSVGEYSMRNWDASGLSHRSDDTRRRDVILLSCLTLRNKGES